MIPQFRYGTVSPEEIAGFGSRFAAWLLDTLLYSLLLVPFAVAAVALVVGPGLDRCDWSGNDIVCQSGEVDAGPIFAGILLGIAGVVLVAVLYIGAMARSGQPWGAKIVGIKVVRSDGTSPIGVGRALGRSAFASFISAQIFWLGYLWAAWDQQTQTWHDKVADTVVIKV